jgi:putative colanic acid biosysnthesis UDP-glucose lipid carrier transferase
MSEVMSGNASAIECEMGARASRPWVGRLSKKMLLDVLAIYDAAAIAFTAWLSFRLNAAFHSQFDADATGFCFVAIVNMLLFHSIARKNGEYDDRLFLSKVSSSFWLQNILISTISSVLVVLFFSKAREEFSQIWLVMWLAMLAVAISAGRAIAIHYIQVFKRIGALRRSVALIGAGRPFQLARTALQQDAQHFNLITVLELPICGVYSESVQPFITEAQVKHANEIIIALPSAMAQEMEKIVRKAQMLPADIRVMPDLGDAGIKMCDSEHVSGLPLLTIVSRPICEWGAFLKAVEDFVFGCLFLILFAPVMVIVAAAIKLDSKGPVFFRQRRHGYNHQIVEVFKFRTMTVMEDGASITQATKNDKRITRVGAFLRRTSLDELPQFLNVVRGEMSVVGPRPHALAHNDYYGNIIENYANRHRVKPGLTGWAQVHGFRGETKETRLMTERVRCDLEYIDNWSIWLDLKIIIMTPLFALVQRSAY